MKAWIANLIVKYAPKIAEHVLTAMANKLSLDDTQPMPLSHKDSEIQAKASRGPFAGNCTKAPEGWVCTREAAHDGQCAAQPL